MKIRIQIPAELQRNQERVSEYVDDILLWGMEVGMDIEHYSMFQNPHSFAANRDNRLWAVFTVEEKDSVMFILRWGATMHKHKPKKEEENGNV